MKDNLMKLRVFWNMFRAFLQDWREEVWDKDPDAYHCCNGRECGCYAMTNREVWDDTFRPRPKS
jgi:hypothetical protein